MIVILAHRWDQIPKALASRWGADDVGILTAQDLSVAGWRQHLHGHLNGTSSGTAVVGQKLVPQNEIDGVLTLLPCVFEQELVETVPEDRRYVAGEMTAFLLFWLSRLECPVLNRPTTTCLSGPYWRREKWIHVAAQAGIPVQPVRRHTVSPASVTEELAVPESATVTVVGECIFGAIEPGLRRQARSLADLAGVELLTVRFSSPEPGACFVAADIFPDLSDNELADATLEYLRGRLVRCT
jgi:hypothetical protein